MKETLKQQLTAVKKVFGETKSNTQELRKDISKKIEALINITPRYEDSWVGDWTKNTDHFYKDFNTSSIEGMNVDEKYIKQDLFQITGIDIDELSKQTPIISRQFFELKDFILSELSFIKEIEAFKNEAELLKQVEEFKWGMRPGDYIRSRRPQYAFVTDLTIMNKGVQIPPHIAVSGDLIFTFSLLTSYDNFEKLAHRLIRQLEIKSTTSSEAEAGSIFQQQALQAVFEKFHSVATQLKNRYNGKPTIVIEDEYDVQDLMNALLRINFEDVRKEEYTPSYAGGSTRVDFLLKREQILIEVKKTRPTLKDKDVGNQLIVDIAHYKSHPDCKHLICFVYDPDNLLVNPRGLEDDLNRNTSEEMIVEVYVRP
jgi:hypothetical protein